MRAPRPSEDKHALGYPRLDLAKDTDGKAYVLHLHPLFGWMKDKEP